MKPVQAIHRYKSGAGIPLSKPLQDKKNHDDKEKIKKLTSELEEKNKLYKKYEDLLSRSRLLNIPSKNEKIAKKNGFYPIENGWKLSYEYFEDERNYTTYKKLQTINIPILFVHGTKDPFVTFKSSLNTSKKCKNSKLYLIDGGDHGFHNEENMKEALDITIDFIKE